MSSDRAVEVRNLTKEYVLGRSGRVSSLATIAKERVRHPIRGSGRKRERFRALDDVTFDVERGEVVGIIGKNGAGKSTLLKILSRITPPTSGYVELDGHVGSLLEVGTGFHPELTGLENVYLNGAILGMSPASINRRLDEIIDFADVRQFLDTPVKRYSSGMRVRLAFAVAAHLDAEILIVDEVLSVGDYSFQAKCLDKMRSVTNDQGRTVLYVSHNLVTVENLCARTMLLEEGRLVFDGSTGEAISRYMQSFPQGLRELTSGVFDLASADRSSVDDAVPVFRRLRLRPNGGPVSDVVRMGDRLRIEIDVKGLNSYPDAMLHAIVGSKSYQVLFRMTGAMQPLHAPDGRHDEETMTIEISELPLTPGEYQLTLWAYSKEGKLIDVVKQAAQFNVVPSDISGSAYHYSSSDGVLVIPWSWAIAPAHSDARVADGQKAFK